MNIADKFSWGGVEQQNDILGIHNLGQETIDRVVEIRDGVHSAWGDVYLNEDGTRFVTKKEYENWQSELPPEPICYRAEPTDSSSSSSTGGEDSGSGENEGSSFTREDGKTRTTKDMNGREITQVWTVGFLGGGTWKEVETPTTPSRPVRNTCTSSSKPKPFIPTAEEKMLDHNWRENSDKMYELQNDQNILREKSAKLTNELNELDTKSGYSSLLAARCQLKPFPTTMS